MLLPANYLREFPVRYETRSGQVAPPTRTRRLRRRGSRERTDSPVDIMFFDSFPGGRGSHGHSAIDILGGLGLPVHATRAGQVPHQWRVIRDGRAVRLPGSGTDVRGGNYIVLVDDEGLYHYYCHLESPPKYAPRATVPCGALLGYLGGTGSRGRGRHQHLHYQVSQRNEHGAPRRDGFVNPYNELLRLARMAGGAFERLSIEGYPANKQWMRIRPANYRR